MEKLQFHKTHLPVLLFLLQFLSLAYALQDDYFINCGSATNANADIRNFVGDMNSSASISSSFSFTRHSSAVTSSASPILYQTARIFRSNSSYEFDIQSNDTYFVLLHFFAFSSSTDLSTALFDSSFAFINAIEVFPAVDSFIPAVAPQISPAGRNISDYKGVIFRTLQTIYRINVGGPTATITPENDTLWRNWVLDDGYINNSETAISKFLASKPNYNANIAEMISEKTAPNLVYQTAKVLNSSGQSSLPNITCKFSTLINSFDYGYELAIPFYVNFVVDSDDSGRIDISIGLYNDTFDKTAFLNGVEIMKILGNSGLSLNEHKERHVFPIVGTILGGLVLICILVVVVFFVFKCRKPKPIENSDWSPVPTHGGGSSHSRTTGGTIPNMNLGLKMPPAIDRVLPGEQVNLAEWGMLCMKKGLIEEIVDPSLKGQIDPNSLRKFIETTEKCLQECGTDRPTMGDVLWDLEYALQLQQTAMPREPHEDSTIGSSAGLELPNVWQFNSISFSVDRDDMPVMRMMTPTINQVKSSPS
ncbi:probable receptor-like protein kinase At5g24010 [Fagus crenata]